MEDNQQLQAEEIVKELKSALKNKDKKRILELYDLAESIEWSLIHPVISEQYEELISDCNDLLYE
jgi:hypothetical protein